MTQLKLKDIQNGLVKIQYKGVPCYKFPFDYVLYQMIIHDVRPDLIIEIGTLHGGSALYYADLMETFGMQKQATSSLSMEKRKIQLKSVTD